MSNIRVELWAKAWLAKRTSPFEFSTRDTLSYLPLMVPRCLMVNLFFLERGVLCREIYLLQRYKKEQISLRDVLVESALKLGARFS